MAHGFGKELAEVRRSQGYETPYAFFRGRGGRKALGLTFPNYLSLERGENLPKGWRLKRLLDALGVLPRSANWKKLIRTYLLDLVGSEELLEGLGDAAPAADSTPASLRLARAASKQLLGVIKKQLTLDQYAVLAKDANAYACHVLLCNTHGGLEEKDLAKRVGAPAAAFKKALAALSAAGMVKKEKARVRSAFEDTFLEPPAPTPAMASVYARLEAHRARWREAGGGVHGPYLLVRAGKEELARMSEHLTEMIHMSAAFAETLDEPDSKLYLVEGKITRIF